MGKKLVINLLSKLAIAFWAPKKSYCRKVRKILLTLDHPNLTEWSNVLSIFKFSTFLVRTVLVRTFLLAPLFETFFSLSKDF